MTIPDVAESEEFITFARNDRDITVSVHAGDAAAFLFHAATDGSRVPLITVATDGTTLALDNVLVADARGAPTHDDSYLVFSFIADDVRVL
jgi:hypothetical protein